ncbi:hypothetical protein ACFLQG_00040 [Candidatus Zixiibacteriota bacterium]
MAQNKSTTIYVTIILLVIFSVLSIYNSFLCDDAFITFRYAHNLAFGEGAVYNSGERVEGYTNFLWMLLLTAVIKLGGQPELWSRIFSLLFSFGVILIFIKHTTKYSDNKFNTFLFPVFLTLSAPFYIWSSGGLETAAFTFFVLGGFISLLKPHEKNEFNKLIFSSIYFIGASLTRPEGNLFFVLIVGYLIYSFFKKRTSLKNILSFTVPYMVLYGGYFIWRYGYYGSLFPNTFYIKTPGYEFMISGLEYYFKFIINSSIWISLILVIYRMICSQSKKIQEMLYFLMFVIFSFSIYVFYTGGDFMAQSRFLVPILPIVYLFFYELTRGTRLNDQSKRFVKIVTISLVIFASVNLYVTFDTQKIWYRGTIDSIGALKNYTAKWTKVATLINNNSQPQDTLAVSAAGIIPYYTGLYTIDVLGLTAPNINEYRQREDVTRPGHSLSIKPEYFFKLKPQFLIGHPKITNELNRKCSFATMKDRKDLFKKYYYLASMELPGETGEYLNFWVRQDIISRIPQKLWY